MLLNLKRIGLSVLLMSAISVCNAQLGPGDVLPKGWFKTGSMPYDYSVTIDKETAKQGTNSVLIASKTNDAKEFVSIGQVADATDFKGSRVKLTAYIKSENVKNWAGFWFRVDNDQGKSIAFDNMDNRRVTGSTQWTQHSLVLDIKPTASTLVYGALLSGQGKIWVDALSFEIVDENTPVTDMYANNGTKTSPHNLSFEID